MEGQLQLSGWAGKRRVVVLRRPRERAANPACIDPRALPWPALAGSSPGPAFEYQVLVTNLRDELVSESGPYAQRADAENVYDALQNHWGWGGWWRAGGT